MRDLIVFGAGGFAQEVAWVVESMNESLSEIDRWNLLGYADDDISRAGLTLYGYQVLSNEHVASRDPEKLWFHCAIGRNGAREMVATRLEASGMRAATLIHPSVMRAKFVEVGEGSYVAPGVVLSPMVVIGRHVLVNQRSSVGHDTKLDDFSQICPGAQINASCTIERGAFVGSNASVHQGRRIGAAAVVGANAQVIRDVAAKTTVAGVPAQVLSRGV